MAEDLTAVVAAFRHEAGYCASGPSPLYGVLLERCAQDIEAGGIIATLVGPFADEAPGSALHLRLMAAVHRAVLERRAPELALCWPSVGGTGDPEQAWPLMRALCEEQAPQMAADLARPCQTNEPGRAAALLAALAWLRDRTGLERLRLLEIGASSGLNLLVDHYRIGDRGPGDSPCLMPDAYPDAQPPAGGFTIVERRGCDLRPVDPRSAEGRLALSSCVWADDVVRWQRLRGALAVALDHPVAVDEESASTWLPTRLAEPFDGLTVVWHSIVRQYVPVAEWAGIQDVLAAYPDVGYARLEPDSRERFRGVPVDVTLHGITARIAFCSPHGPPVRLV